MIIKKISILACIIISYNTVSSQTTTGASIQKDFGMISNLGKAQSGFESFQTYSAKDVNGSQFLPDTWSNGSVTTNTNITISSGYLFLYDKVRQTLYIRPKDSNMIVVAEKSEINFFTLNATETYSFAKASIYDSSASASFFQVLISGNYTLLKSINTSFEKANPNDLERAHSGDHRDAFIDKETYYVYHNGKLQKIKLTENSIRRIFTDNSSALNNYLNLHQADEINETFLENLVSSLN